MESLHSKEGYNERPKAPEYSAITKFVAIIYILYMGFVFLAVYSVYALYYPQSVKVYSPFDDSKKLIEVSYWDAILCIMISVFFISFIFLGNCLTWGAGAYNNSGIEASIKYSFASAIITGNKYASCGNILPTLSFLG